MLTKSKAALCVVLLVWASLVDAQQAARVPRIGVLTWEGCPNQESPFGLGLKDLGYVWGKSVEIICRSGQGDYVKLSEAAALLVAEKVDVIAAPTQIAAHAALSATKSIPIVMIASGDPVKTGMVASLARPGGNVTGITYYGADLVEKRLQLLKEIVPGMRRVALLANHDSDHVFGMYRQDAERGARALDLQIVWSEANRPTDLPKAFEAAVSGGAQGLVVLTDPMLNSQAKRIAVLAAEHRLPAMYWGPSFMAAGGLAAYSADFDAMIRRTAYYVDRIIKGARPTELPVEQPTQFHFVLNRKTAKTLGLPLSPLVLLRADRLVD